jgi:hypothetical protein
MRIRHYDKPERSREFTQRDFGQEPLPPAETRTTMQPRGRKDPVTIIGQTPADQLRPNGWLTVDVRDEVDWDFLYDLESNRRRAIIEPDGEPAITARIERIDRHYQDDANGMPRTVAVTCRWKAVE